MRWISLVVLLVLMLGGGGARAQSFLPTCADTLPSQLVPGMPAQVTPGPANNLRAEPSVSASRIGRIPGGEQVQVLDGPECAEGFAWYRVDYDGLVGWTVEAVEGVYSLVPITRLAPGDVTFTLPDALIGVTLTAVTLPATPPEWEDGPGGWLEHVEYRLSGGWVGERGALAHLSVFPLDAVTEDPRYAAYQAIMADGLDSWPPNEDLPTLFAINAAQQIVAAPRIVELENMRGYQFFTAYGQDRIPLLRDSLLYVFQGVTTDERAFISLVIPVTISTLAAEDDGPWLTLDDEGEIVLAYINTYVPRVAAVIARSPETAFSPRIADIWAWLERIKVHRTP